MQDTALDGHASVIAGVAGPFNIPRPRLWRRLDEVPDAGVAVIVAPAGSGKTVLLSQWVHARPELHVARLELAPRHDDAVVCATDLVAALGSAVPGLGLDLVGSVMTGGAALGELFLDRLVAELASAAAPLVIVLDDVHNMRNPGLLADLGRLALALPTTTRLVMASRWDLPLHLARLSLAERLIELRDEDLSFTSGEALELVTAVSRRTLPEETVRRLVDRTDGWAVGLQLAAISLQRAEDPEVCVAEFVGSDRLVAEYLTEEVLGRQDAAARRFLLDTSVLPWLSADLCDAVTGGGDSRAQLRRLSEQSLFLVPLDRSGDRFRYHHLFADLLRYQLQVERPDDVRGLRVLAAGWLRAHGAHADAIGEYLAAGEPLAALDVLDSVSQGYFERGESATLVQWFAAIRAAADPAPVAVEINLLAALVAADEAVAAAETYRQLARRRDLSAGERAAADALYSCLGFDDLAPAEVLAASAAVAAALETLDPRDVPDFLGIGGHDSVQLMAEFMGAVARFHRGDVAGAAEILDHVRTLRGMSYAVWRIYVLGALALTRAWVGRLNEARQLAASCLAAAEEVGLAHNEYVTYGYLASALVAVERLEIDEARHCLAESARRNLLRRDTSFFDVHRNIEARLATTAGQEVEARTILGRPARSAVEPAVLTRANQVLSIRLYLRSEDVLRARTLLSRDSSAADVAKVDVALAEGELDEARGSIQEWWIDDDDVTARVEHLLRSAALAVADGDDSAGVALVTEALRLAEVEGLRRPFLDVAGVWPVLVRLAERNGEVFARSVTAGRRRTTSGQRAGGGLIDPLTDRELDILRYLPTRLNNADIAAELYLSVNTVKTHLRHIYWKLEVTDRDAAVDRAATLGLL